MLVIVATTLAAEARKTARLLHCAAAREVLDNPAYAKRIACAAERATRRAERRERARREAWRLENERYTRDRLACSDCGRRGGWEKE